MNKLKKLVLKRQHTFEDYELRTAKRVQQVCESAGYEIDTLTAVQAWEEMSEDYYRASFMVGIDFSAEDIMRFILEYCEAKDENLGFTFASDTPDGKYESALETAQEIAAALNSHDELLAALKKLMRFHPEDEAGPMSEEYWTPEYREAMTLAKSVLAKAEGQPAQPDQTAVYHIDGHECSKEVARGGG